MALINKIREKSGIAVTVIAVSLIFFIVGGDLLGPRSFFGGNNTTVGEIRGKKIDYKDFQERVDAVKRNYEAQVGRAANEAEVNQMREQAWMQFISEYAYEDEYKKLGLKVTDDETVDMVQGDHLSPSIIQAFTDPSTGAFNKNGVVEYLRNLKTLGPAQQASWVQFEEGLKMERLRQKLEKLLSSSVYVTKAEAEKEYVASAGKSVVDYLYVPYYSVADSTISVSDSQLGDYLKSHSKQYKGVDSRTVQYVTFPIMPSKEDSTQLYDQIKLLAKELATTTNDSTFVRVNSDVQLPLYQSYANMSDQLKEAVKTFVPGGVFGPYREGNTYYIYKYGGTKTDTVYSVKASHILIRFDNPSDSAKAESRKKAESILAQIRGGASFEAMAMANSADQGSAQRGGDLGYFQNNGTMVKPFEEAVFSHPGTGLINRVIESQFGYHIIKVTEAKTNTLYRLASIGKTIIPSQATRDEVYNKASQFALESKSAEQFTEKAKKENLHISTASRLLESSNNINAIADGREIVRWAFADKTDLNKVSQVFETEEQYVVAVVTNKTDKKNVKVNDFRTEITEKVRNRLKAEKIIGQLKDSKGELDAISSKYGPGSIVEKDVEVNLLTGMLKGAGFDPQAAGKAVGLKAGKRMGPFEGENGVFIIQSKSTEPAPEIADYSQYKNQLLMNKSGSVPYLINEAVQESANIVDNRARFY
ncbi:peptidylprolyl isomerase [Ravibacter arvi]|uniref:Periplasmic chaperone PpiD n=1 Tax=Ravibacter arvi TaxID=2051041 RepID=A0ABP8LWZ7_9BACT